MAVVAIAAVSVVGMAIYAMTRTIETPGQKLGELARQTAKEGEPRLIVYGVVRPIGGNLLAVQEPPRIVKKKQKSGGKGGGGSSTSTEVPYRTYAVGICEGPITGIRRVWRNNKLVYDARPGSEWGTKNNGTFLKKARFFLGGWEQMPSSDLEAVFGVGNVPPMRGTAYMVMADEDLGDMGGAVPQWIFEVVRAEGYALTSPPYPIVSAESSQGDADLAGGYLGSVLESYAVSERLAVNALGVASGELRSALESTALTESVAVASFGIDAGTLRAGLVSYAGSDQAQVSEQGVASGVLRIGRIQHLLAPERAATVSMGVSQGSLQNG